MTHEKTLNCATNKTLIRFMFLVWVPPAAPPVGAALYYRGVETGGLCQKQGAAHRRKRSEL